MQPSFNLLTNLKLVSKKVLDLLNSEVRAKEIHNAHRKRIITKTTLHFYRFPQKRKFKPTISKMYILK